MRNTFKLLLFIFIVFLIMISCKNDNETQKNQTKSSSKPTIVWKKEFDFTNDNDYIISISIDKNNQLYVIDNHRLIVMDENGNFTNEDNHDFDYRGIMIDQILFVNDHMINIYGEKKDIGNEKKEISWFITKTILKNNENIWYKKIIIDSDDYSITNLSTEQNNSIYIGGYFYNKEKSQYESWIMSGVDNTTNLSIKWKNQYEGDIVKLLPFNNQLYVVGYGDNLVRENSQEDWWLKKLDESGNEDTVNWDKHIDGIGMEDKPTDAALDSEGNLYVVGYGRGISGKDKSKRYPSTDWWLKKFYPDGSEDFRNWNKIYSKHESFDEPDSIIIDKDDNIYVGGTTQVFDSGGWWIKKFDKNGNEDPNWDLVIELTENNDEITCMAIDNENYLYVAGFGTNLAGEDTGKDWCIIKIDPLGKRD